MTPFIILGVLIILNLIVLAVGVFFLLEIIGAIIAPVPFVPVPNKIAYEAATLIQLPDGGTMYDLGSGDGRVVFAAAHMYPRARAIGVEKAPLPHLLALFQNMFKKQKNAILLRKDLFKIPLTDASAVFTYLLPKMMDKLHPKLVAELPKGTQLVSCDFKFSEQEPIRVIPVTNGKKRPHTLYVYQF